MIEVGGYDENLFRNQDNDMNQKLRASGHRLYCTWKTHCIYHTPGKLEDLLKYAFRNGYWNVVSLFHNASSMGLRHFVPLLFVLGLLISVLGALFSPMAAGPYRDWLEGLPLGLLGLHLSVGILGSLLTAAQRRDGRALLLPGVFLAFHLAYGLGSLWALFQRARLLYPGVRRTSPC
jgi:hypothetical protein